MKKHHIAKILFPLLVLIPFILLSCAQDAIFYYVSREVAPRDPRISGTPTNIVEFNGAVFAASKGLHRYAPTSSGSGDAVWDSPSPPQPGFSIASIAVTNTYLYALSMGATELKRIHKGTAGLGNLDETTGWETVSINSDASGYPLLQTIYADSNRIFAGAKNTTTTNNNFAILYGDDSAPAALNLKLLKGTTGVLSGAVLEGGIHYLSTTKSYVDKTANGGGIYTVPDASLSGTPSVTGPLKEYRDIMGLIKLGTQIIAIDRNGDILDLTPTNFTSLGSVGYTTAGSLALWYDPAAWNNSSASPADKEPKLLLAGISTLSNSYDNGYREIGLTGGALATSFSVNEPGLPSDRVLTSDPDNTQYVSSLGTHPINFLYQVPYAIDKNMPVFASTQLNGLWSYKDRGDGPEWNAEE
jgi:hypothetical protein